MGIQSRQKWNFGVGFGQGHRLGQSHGFGYEHEFGHGQTVRPRHVFKNTSSYQDRFMTKLITLLESIYELL